MCTGAMAHSVIFRAIAWENMIAAQLWAHVRNVRPTVEDDFAPGRFHLVARVAARENPYAGPPVQCARTGARVTNEELSPQHLVRYLRERYGRLYLDNRSPFS